MKKLIFNNFGLKIASVILAITLWFIASSRGQSEMYIDVPLIFKNIPSGLQMINSSERHISLNIKGPERIIKNIKPSDIRAIIDLSNVKKGESIYYITKDNIQLPHSVTILNISPSNIKVKTEKTVKKSVEVIPVIIGKPEKGFIVESIEVLPQKVEIEGIMSEIKKIKKIKTKAFEITGLSETIIRKLDLDIMSKNIKIPINTVKVTVKIKKRDK